MNLLERCAEDRRVFELAMTAVGAGGRESIARSEWRSTGNLIRHSVGRFLGRGLDKDGERRLKFLDVGFGVGRGVHYVVDFLAVPQETVHGIEMFQDHVEKAAKRWPEGHFKVMPPTEKGLADALDRWRKGGQWFDLILLRNVIQFQERPRDLLRRLSAMLPEGRLLAVVVPKGAGIYETSAVSSPELDWDSQGVDETGVKAGSAIQGATARLPHKKFRWRGGLGPMFKEVGLEVVDMGHRTLNAAHQTKESYAICRRVP